MQRILRVQGKLSYYCILQVKGYKCRASRVFLFKAHLPLLQEALQQMRAVDDKIIYRLNTSVPTISFADQVSASDECKHLYEQVRHTCTPSK